MSAPKTSLLVAVGALIAIGGLTMLLWGSTSNYGATMLRLAGGLVCIVVGLVLCFIGVIVTDVRREAAKIRRNKGVGRSVKRGAARDEAGGD